MVLRIFMLVLNSHTPCILSSGTLPQGMDWLNEAAAKTCILA
jgi:hypothetical protein